MVEIEFKNAAEAQEKKKLLEQELAEIDVEVTKHQGLLGEGEDSADEGEDDDDVSGPLSLPTVTAHACVARARIFVSFHPGYPTRRAVSTP